MITRTLTTFGLVGAIGCAIFFLGVQAGVWMLTAVALIAQLELYGLFARMGMQPLWRSGLVYGGLVMLGSYYIPTYLNLTGRVRVGTDMLVLGVIGLSVGAIAVAKDHEEKFRSLMSSLVGLIYIPYMLHFLIVLVVYKGREVGTTETHGLIQSLWIIAVAKSSDIGALLTGKAFGKTPLAPHLSPKKTWEGAIGGVIYSAAVGTIWITFTPRWFPEALGQSWLLAIALAALTGIVATLSDLIESIFKRHAGVKDSGQVVPGIGGAFDLTDSLILTAPFGYFIFRYVLA